MDKQPEALELADLFDIGDFALHRAGAKELRRLHQINQELRESVKKANAQAEHFERLWYLRGDVNEELVEALEMLVSFADESEGCQYGTLSTSLVRQIAKEALAKHKEQA